MFVDFILHVLILGVQCLQDPVQLIFGILVCGLLILFLLILCRVLILVLLLLILFLLILLILVLLILSGVLFVLILIFLVLVFIVLVVLVLLLLLLKHCLCVRKVVFGIHIVRVIAQCLFVSIHAFLVFLLAEVGIAHIVICLGAECGVFRRFRDLLVMADRRIVGLLLIECIAQVIIPRFAVGVDLQCLVVLLFCRLILVLVILCVALLNIFIFRLAEKRYGNQQDA